MSSEFLLRIRKLIVVLAFSGVLNIALAGALGYYLLKEAPPAPYCELVPISDSGKPGKNQLDYSNRDVIRRFRSLSREQLSAKLFNSQLIENGYSERDLALACLVTFHHFDLERALAPFTNNSLQKRSLCYGKNSKGALLRVTAFAGLADEHFMAIISFAKTERYPFTPKGLFYILQQQYPRCEHEACDAFFLTAEFAALERLFARVQAPLERDELLQLVLEGEWDTLNAFVAQQRIAHDITPQRRQQLLCTYLAQHSATAASIMLKTEGHFALKKLDDDSVIALLELLEKNPPTVKYALALLLTPRSDAVWKSAITALYSYAGEVCPAKCSPQVALTRFAPMIAKRLQPEPGAGGQVASEEIVIKQSGLALSKDQDKGGMLNASTEKLYTVQDGDNLWKISRRFKVNVNQLKEHNKLISDLLQPGLALRIP